MNSLGLSGISTSLGSDMVCGSVSYRFRTIVLLLVADLTFLLSYTVKMLDIHSCGVLPSCMWYTKRLLVYPCFCFVLDGTLSSSNPLSVLRSMDPFADIGFLPVAGLPAEPLHVFETSVVIMGIQVW
jgi:hypothetical protein